MSDRRKSCIGFFFVAAAVMLGLVAGIAGWQGVDLRSGVILGIGTFIFFFVLAAYFFLKIENWGLLPFIATGIYAILPDLIIGPEDDIILLIIGAAVSGLLTWRIQAKDEKKKELQG